MQTIRRKIIELLSEKEMNARLISQAIGISEKEVYGHLSHIDKTAAAMGKKFEITPARCMSCAYTFDARKRYTRPGRCPVCKKERIESPWFNLS